MLDPLGQNNDIYLTISVKTRLPAARNVDKNVGLKGKSQCIIGTGLGLEREREMREDERMRTEQYKVRDNEVVILCVCVTVTVYLYTLAWLPVWLFTTVL